MREPLTQTLQRDTLESGRARGFVAELLTQRGATNHRLLGAAV